MKNILLTAILIFGLTTISIAQVPAYVPTNGLVGWWPFNGNANDLSVNNLNANVLGGATLTTDRSSNVNASYDFDYSTVSFGGQTDEVYIPFNPLLNVNFITVSVWLYPRSYYWTGDSGNPNSIILNRFQYGYSTPNGEAWGVAFNQNSVTGFILGSTGASAISNTPLNLNVWHHIVMTYDGANIKLYVDGSLSGIQNHTAAMNIAGNSGISIGESNQANGYWNQTDGKIDDIGIWNRALTACEINNLYTSGSVTTTTTAASICIGASTTITASGATTYAWMPGNLTGATITVSPTSTTTYTVTGTNTSGCTNTATRIITVNPLPVVTTTTTAYSICIGASTTITASGASTYTWLPGNLTGSTITVSPTSTTTYTVTGTNASGCTNTATRIITVNPLPVVTTTTTAATICIGASTTITASGATTYAWMPGNLTGSTVTVSPITTTTYTVTGTSATGCVNTATRIITVNPNPLPVVTTTTTAVSICIGASTTITASGASTYTWLPGNLTGSTITVSPTSTTTYTVTGTNASGCTNTATRIITVNPLPVVTTTNTSAAVCTGGSVTLTGGGAVTYAWSGGVTNAVSFIPSATTTYTVTGTNSNGCVNTATTTVTVNPLPAVTANSSAASVCAGGSVTLTGGGAATYSWSNNVMNAVSFIPNSTATYTVTGTDANGCMNTAVIMVTVNPLPIVTATISSAAVCINDANATLTGTPTGGVWSGTGVTGSNFNPAIAGLGAQTASYSYTDANGCVGIIGTVNIYVYSCVGLEENLLANGVSVYPNPAKSQINVKVDATLIGSIYIVFDNHGKKVLSGKINSENTIVELENLSAGVYLLNIGENLKQTFKVIKE